MTTNRIDHVAEARASLGHAYRHREMATDHSHRNDVGGARHHENAAMGDLAFAQVEATLALVEQQRIANLLAFWAMPEAEHEALGEHVAFGVARSGIREGLGL